jgi:hypothetical protein
MHQFKAAFLISSVVVLGACAHNQSVATPVALKVTSKTADRAFVSDVRKATLKAIGNGVPEARPLTVTVDLDVTTERMMTSPYAVTGGGSVQRPIRSTSPDPTTDGALPAVPDNGFPAPAVAMDAVTGVHVLYTISDSSGRVLESDQSQLNANSIPQPGSDISVDANASRRAIVTISPLWSNRGIVSATAGFLASRVKAVSQ